MRVWLGKAWGVRLGRSVWLDGKLLVVLSSPGNHRFWLGRCVMLNGQLYLAIWPSPGWHQLCYCPLFRNITVCTCIIAPTSIAETGALPDRTTNGWISLMQCILHVFLRAFAFGWVCLGWCCQCPQKGIAALCASAVFPDVADGRSQQTLNRSLGEPMWAWPAATALLMDFLMTPISLSQGPFPCLLPKKWRSD